MRVDDRVIGLCGIVVSVGLIMSIKDLFFKTKALPMAVLIILLIVSVILVVRKSHKAYVYGNFQDVALTIAVLGVYIFALKYIGFIISTMLFLSSYVLLFKYEGKRIVIVLFILAVPLLTYYLFRVLLHVRIPEILF